MNNYSDAEEWYAKAITLPKASRIDHYYYAEVLLRDEKFDEAKAQYKIYYAGDADELAIKLSNCDSAALWMRHPSNYKIRDAESLNTQYSDWGLSYDGKLGFIFTSDRVVDNENTDDRTGNNWFKLYHANINQDEVSELPISNASSVKFIGSYHAGPMTLNKAADTAYITVTTEVSAKNLDLDKPSSKSTQKLYTRRLQLLMARKLNGQWVIFGSFPYNNIQKYSIGNAALSANGRLIYFSSDMPGGEGKTDIWYCEKRANGTWGEPVNCGKTINTKEEDAFPYIDNNGTLYYASKGLPGMGGYDIYTANGEKAQWSTPKNLKYPVNTTSDDFYLVTRNGTSGYLSSNRDGGLGSDDIYAFTHVKADTVPSKHYKLSITPGISPALPPNTQQSRMLNTIYFDLDRSNIRPDAVIELDKLVVLLKQYPTMKIELNAYTDSRASSQYNIGLSQRRAKAAFDYLVKKGISPQRLTTKWYGKTNPVNQCADGVNCTEAEHQLNRRVEFRMVER